MHDILVILGLVATFLVVVSHGDLVPALVEADGRFMIFFFYCYYCYFFSNWYVTHPLQVTVNVSKASRELCRSLYCLSRVY